MHDTNNYLLVLILLFCAVLNKYACMQGVSILLSFSLSLSLSKKNSIYTDRKVSVGGDRLRYTDAKRDKN